MFVAIPNKLTKITALLQNYRKDLTGEIARKINRLTVGIGDCNISKQCLAVMKCRERNQL